MNFFTCSRILKWVSQDEDDPKESTKGRVQAVILDMTSEFQLHFSDLKNFNDRKFTIKFDIMPLIDPFIFCLTDLMNVDTSGILALEELHKRLLSRGVEVRPP